MVDVSCLGCSGMENCALSLGTHLEMLSGPEPNGNKAKGQPKRERGG